ncbi:MAG: hypothetical protein ACR2NZ_01860 [Rubripirellula sp.]
MDGQATLTPENVTEIERHKYFLSERAGHDVGWDFAEQDWVSNYGSLRVDSAETTGEAFVPAPHSDSPVQSEPLGATDLQTCSDLPKQTDDGSGLGKWFRRLLSK